MKKLFLSISSVVVAAALVLSVSGNKPVKQEALFMENVEALAGPEIYCGPFCVDDEGLCVYIFWEFGLADIFDGVLLPYYG